MPTYRSETVRGERLFFREAGPRDAPTIVLLHGFPSSSHMFRELIPKLEDRFHLIAPDLIGFGYSACPSTTEFSYTFDNLSSAIEELLFEKLALRSFALYVQDYGAPVGFRIATRRPQAIDALIVQNGNAYLEGLSDAWQPIRDLWRRRDAGTEHGVRSMLTAETTKFQYVHGVTDPASVSPDSYTFDQFFLDRPQSESVQIALFADYASNLQRYAEWQSYFRTHQPPTLLVWGKHDPFFTVEGAKAFSRDLPSAELHFLETGHFAIEDRSDEIGSHIRRFLTETVRTKKRQHVTVVLVHAAWADGSSWNKVSIELYRHGFDVVAVQIPLTSLTDDVAAVRRVLHAQKTPVVLAGHSYGGAVMTAAASGLSVVKALVYVAAMAPDAGETVGELFYRATPHPLAPELKPDEGGFVRLGVDAFHHAVAPEADFENRILLATTQKPVSVKCISEALTTAAWHETPSWYLIAEHDRVLSPETQRFMATRMGAMVISAPTDHSPLISQPRVVADVIRQAAIGSAAAASDSRTEKTLTGPRVGPSAVSS